MWNRPENQIETWTGTQTGKQAEIRLTLIRHGATLSNKEGRYLGKTDEALSPEGIGMLEKAVTDGNYPAAGLLFFGPMKRCIETAQILYPGQTPIIIPEWTEMDFGAFEGHNYKELSGDPDYQRWIDSGGTLPFPEGESREEFIRRSAAGYEKMLYHIKTILERGAVFGQNYRNTGWGEPEERDESKAQNVGIPNDLTQNTDMKNTERKNTETKNTGIRSVSAVVHGGTIMALLSHFLGGEYFDYQVKCGQGYSGRLVFPVGGGAPEWKEFCPLSECTVQELAKGETW